MLRIDAYVLQALLPDPDSLDDALLCKFMDVVDGSGTGEIAAEAASAIQSAASTVIDGLKHVVHEFHAEVLDVLKQAPLVSSNGGNRASVISRLQFPSMIMINSCQYLPQLTTVKYL